MSGEMKSWAQAVKTLKKDPAKQELIYQCYLDDDITQCVRRYSESSEWQSIRQHLPCEPLKALDIGAGRGITTYALAKEGWKVTALEPETGEFSGTMAIHKMIELTNLNYVSVVQGVGEDLPFNDREFDMVFARQVLHHASNPVKFCQEVNRVLKSGGLFMFIREHVISKREDLILFLEKHPLHGLYTEENAYTLGEYKSFFKKTHLHLKKVLGVYDSEINLYPRTKAELKKRWENKLSFSLPRTMFEVMLKIRNYTDDTPGRLYSFMGAKG